MARKMLGILGGTFDPIHLGHLRSALEVYQRLHLDELLLIPCRIPVHKQQGLASAEARVAMIKLAIAGQQGFHVDEREIQRDTPSYMHTTLQSLRAEQSDAALLLILGADAFLGLQTWYRFQEIMDLAHLVVLERPKLNKSLPEELITLIAKHATTNTDDLAETPNGKIIFISTTQLNISSTEIRALIAKGQSVRYLVPEAVWQYMENQKIYR